MPPTKRARNISHYMEINDQEEVVAEAEVTTEADTTDWKAEFEAELGRRKRLETRLSKLSEPKTEIKTAPSKSEDLDYGQKAFLVANGIKGAKELDFVKSELKKSGQELESLLENGYFKSQLENFRALAQTAEAVPTGKQGAGAAIDSVEYWATKPFEEVPKDMRAKVVNYKLDKEKNKGHFYNS